MSDQPVIRSRKTNSLRRRDGLIKYACDYTSQNGEDGVLGRIFQLCRLPSPSTGYNCVDLGAWDGKHLSNTHSLIWKTYRNEDQNNASGWKGVLIEANTERFAELSSLYASTPDTLCINAAVSVEGDMWTNPRSIVKLLSTHAPQMETDFDFLCIDIDGSDYWVWNDLLKSQLYRPKVVCIEFNPTMPNDLVYIPARSDSIRHGASLSALCELAFDYSYTLVETTLFNAFFVRTELYEAYLVSEVPDTSIEALHETTMGTTLYQLYDGTIKISGCKRMLWHRLPIDEQKLQMIPDESRSFVFPDIKESFHDSSQINDLSPYFLDSSTGDEAKLNSSRQLLQHLQSTGFCYVCGTTLSQTDCQAALENASAFLHTADETVRRSCLATDRARRGYSPMNVENFASLIGEQGPNDLVRKFRIGAEDEEYNSLKQPNIWPDDGAWEGARMFRVAIEKYFQNITKVSRTIVQAICDGILWSDPSLKEVLQPITMIGDECWNETTSILTLLGYRPGSRHKGKNKGPLVAAHTDVGVITVLLFENSVNACAKLQRSDGKGGWLDVTLPSSVPKDPIFVVNVADCFSELCRGTVASTLHRVVACRTGTEPRSCLALFVGLDSETLLHMPEGTMTYEQWRKRRIEKSQATLRASRSSFVGS